MIKIKSQEKLVKYAEKLDALKPGIHGYINRNQE